MLKNLSKIFLTIIFVALSAGSVLASATDVSIRLAQPQSPSNQDTYNITFTALDIQGRAMTVKCFKKGPSEAAFTQFGSDISLSAGGNTGNCQVNSSVVVNEGTYSFYATANAGSDTATSTTISVQYKKTGPGDPVNYSKERPSDCVYKIKFRTADDSGKTVKVKLYRSDSTTVDASSVTQVDSISIGSSTDGQFENTVGDCGRTYYFGVRAFDDAGNGSNMVGDTIDKSNIIIPTGTTGGSGVSGAIPVGSGQGQVLGEETKDTKGKGEIKGAETKDQKGEVKEEKVVKEGLFSLKNLLTTGIIAAVFVLFYFLWRRTKRA